MPDRTVRLGPDAVPAAWTVRDFEILDTLGQGGMGIVYRARQPSMAREVALKALSFGGQRNPDLAARFLQEARIGGSLAHPNVVVVYDYFEADGAAFIAMELVERGPLTPFMPGLTVTQSAGVLEALLAALERAGAAGIVHRDLKPANLLVTRDWTVKVADFGIAKALQSTHAGATASGATMGTPAYMAPEQAAGDPVDPRTDLYTAGVIAYELLAGRPPFDPRLPSPTLLYKHVHEVPARPQTVNPQLNPRLGEWIEWLLAKRPDDRPPDAATAWKELETIVVEQFGWRWRDQARVSAGAATSPKRHLPPAARTRRRRRAIAASAAAATAAAAATIAVVALGDGDDETRGRTSPTPTSTPDANTQRLLAMLPASLRDACAPNPQERNHEIASVKCDRWGATFYYDLYQDALEARSAFTTLEGVAKDQTRGHAETCPDADERKWFVGTWSRPGGPVAGRLICRYTPGGNDGVAERQWSVNGSPVVAKALYYSGVGRESAAEGARLAWREATR